MKDYIVREKVLKDLLDQCKITGYGGLTANDVKYVFSLQTNADVRPVVRGKWIPDYDYAEYDYDGSTPLAEPRKFQDGWQCSLCGGYMPSETNFCPNCGSYNGGDENG